MRKRTEIGLLLAGLAFGGFLAGCDGSTGSGPEDLVNQGQTLTDETYEIKANQAVQMYKASHAGKLPESLDDVKNLPSLPPNKSYHYDPQTGKVTIR